MSKDKVDSSYNVKPFVNASVSTLRKSWESDDRLKHMDDKLIYNMRGSLIGNGGVFNGSPFDNLAPKRKSHLTINR